jgi:outer membrane lipoprotein SlyB
MKIKYLVIALGLLAFEAYADNSTLDAAIGGGIGGAAGAAIGNEVGGRNGAIAGGALGAAVGVAVNTDKQQHSIPAEQSDSYKVRHYEALPATRFCPPGQAKKGRC